MLLINKKYIMFDDLSYMNLIDGTVSDAPFGLMWFNHNVENIDKLYLRALGGE